VPLGNSYASLVLIESFWRKTKAFWLFY